MKAPRALWRALRGGLHVLRGLWTIRNTLPGLSQPQVELLLREWTRHMLNILGVELVVHGTPPAQGPLLQVANHISWLDILVMNGARPSRFVSKSDAQHWPVLGALISGAGTLYIERSSRRDAMRMVHHMAERLTLGDILSVFPEGTTGDGSALLPFHANLLQAAIVAKAPVLPVALRFVDRRTGQPHPAPVFVGETTLIASIWSVLMADGLQAVVHYGDPQHDQGRERRVWAEDLRAEIERLLQQQA
ncbi:lysophospholipid acyltransferase family protein [Hydrogenophaga palleronii]|uniref:lysophospholipid acyltransferase family protein n=1 Tax=Hydrogenophaga palleronii TaxID=65655 RepID=UPI0008270AC0|nr:lysophospholipid acyltransferase family protein [Hydrogenophaga palleronii]